MPTKLNPPFRYSSLLDYTGSLANGKKLDTLVEIVKKDTEFASSSQPGVQIMRKVQKLVRTTDTERNKFEGLWMTLVEHSRAAGWTWAPQQSERGSRLIDGVLTAVECAGFAGGLFLLAVAPPPFGLGMAKDDSGQNGVAPPHTFSDKTSGSNLGFVSAHPRGGVLNLMPNVHTPLDAPLDEGIRGTSFYLWSNHKTTLFDGRWFDPSYGVQYAAEPDMVLMTVTGREGLGLPPRTPINDKMEETDTLGRIMLTCRTAQARTYYLRKTPTSLEASEGSYQGPFTQSQRDWLSEQLTGAEPTAAPIGAAEVFKH